MLRDNPDGWSGEAGAGERLAREGLYVCACVLSCFSHVRLCDHMDCSLPGSSARGNSPGKNTGVGCCALLQGIFLTKGSNLCLLYLLH